MSNLVVSELAIYPVKSFARIQIPVTRVNLSGLNHDRRWMVTDLDGKFLTQRQLPRMCLIKPELGPDAGLVLNAPGKKEINVQIPSPDTTPRPVQVWGDTCNALDCGDSAAKWLAEFLETECRLVYFPGNEVRQVDQQYANPGDHTAFADGFPILMTTLSSLDDLNSRLDQPVAMRRFRPNMVIGGRTNPFEEDDWKRIRIGEVTFRIVKPCSRCIIPNIDPDTGIIGKEPAKTLAEYRKWNNKVHFGQNVIADNEGLIEIGMPVEILE